MEFQPLNYSTLEDLPLKYRQIFQSYSSFNSIQTQTLSHIFNKKNSLVITAPTGSGKTVILELAIVKLLMNFEKTNFNNDFKVVYVCPVKALCNERFNDWEPKFRCLGISCIEVTGDGGDYFDLVGYNLIITTPEKWDSLTRKWRDNAGLVQLVKLFLIDEVHLLGDFKRGPVLEAIVCRMKTVSKVLKLEPVRFVAISATIYNVEDLALWLGTKDSPADFFKFGNDVRPVQLQKIVKGYYQPPKQSDFLFDIQLSYKLKTVILDYSNGKPSLVFCSTRKSVLQTAKILSEQLTFHFTQTQLENLSDGAAFITDNKLRELILCGIGYHHAGVTSEDRHHVQNLFASGSLPILVATSTLAMGVNLPAHLVVIKSTKQYKAGRLEEYPESSILQMIGRAGRPQFDTTAIAIIMTKNDTVGKYEKMLESKEVIESSLHLHLPEYLNSEIVLYTITDLSVAMEWICNTFLYVRAMKNPKYYGLDPSGNRFKIEKGLELMCLKEINGLKKAELIEVSDNGMDISPTAHGRLMSHFYLSFETFKIFLQIKGTETMDEILSSLCEAHEFCEVQLRVNERKTLNELNRNKNRDHIRFPMTGKIKTRGMKVNCLIQACLGCLHIQDPALYQESVRIVKIAERLAKCLSEFLSKKPHHRSILNTTILAKCLHSKLWEDSPYLSRQLDRIGPTLGTLLAACGKTSFTVIKNSNPRDLEGIINRAPPFGNHLQEAVEHLPKYGLTANLMQSGPNNVHRANVRVTLLNADDIRKKNTAGEHHWVVLIVGDTNNNLLSYNRFTDFVLLQKDIEVAIRLTYSDLPHKLIANVISEQWVGIDVATELIIDSSAETVQISTPDNTRVKKKKKIEHVKLNQTLPNNFHFGKKSEGNKAEETNSKNEFVACFDVDVEIIEKPAETFQDVEMIPEISHCDTFKTPKSQAYGIIQKGEGEEEINHMRKPLLSLENIYESLAKQRTNERGGSRREYQNFNNTKSGYFFTGGPLKKFVFILFYVFILRLFLND